MISAQYQHRSKNMDFGIEKKISNFVENQFPQFYQEEGPDFILFTKAYYEWMESEGQIINQSRSLLELRDIDSTLESFLEHFQRKYLYGIPFNVIINKQFLLKHILDVYRSKGTIQCYKLLFKLIYNQDIDIYLPGNDILKPSDGTWVQPLYLEITQSSLTANLIGKTIVGASSNTTAVVENYISEPVNQNIITTLFISNMMPKGGQFAEGEKIVNINDSGNAQIIEIAPKIIGSLNSLRIINGGQNFNIGDIIEVAHRDIITNAVTSKGVGAKLRVTGLSRAQGSINFDIVNSGFGYTANTKTFVYNGVNDNTGNGASFNISGFSYIKSIQYNTDLIVDHSNTLINSATFGFVGNTSANNSSNLNQAFAYQNNYFGSIATLNNINTGNNYTNNLNIFVRSTQLASKPLNGTITYTTSSNNITLSGSYADSSIGANGFSFYFNANDVIYLQANSSNSSSIELQIIKSVNSNTSITLYGPPKCNSTSSAIFKTAPVTLPSNFALYEPTMFRLDNTINGENEYISGTPSIGNNIIANTVAIDSGKGYVDGEIVSAYLYNGLNYVTIVSSGINYANLEPLIITRDGESSPASGYVTTDSSGAITSVVLTNGGSNYVSTPLVSVKTLNGTGAVLTTNVNEFNTTVQITGKVVKSGVGRKQGYWSTTRGFLNSDKYIQDSYFYQDYSYQIKAALLLDKYKDVLYNTFHSSGSELFGQFYLQIEEQSSTQLLYESSGVTYLSPTIPTADSTLITADNSYITADQIP